MTVIRVQNPFVPMMAFAGIILFSALISHFTGSSVNVPIVLVVAVFFTSLTVRLEVVR